MTASSFRTGCAIVLALGLLTPGAPARAAILVLGASDPAVAARYHPGALIETGAVTLAAGEWLQVLFDGKSRRLTGPTGAKAAAAKPAERRILEGLQKAQARRIEFGAVRGGEGSERPASPWLVDVGRSETVCVEAGSKPQLWRADASATLRASLEAGASGERRFFAWPAATPVVAWPAEIPVKEGRYLFYDGLGAPRQLEVKVVAKGLKDADLLAVLADRECLAQLTLAVGLR